MDTPSRNILLQQPWFFELFTTGDGTLHLEVLCGTVGLYEICVRLNEDELREYRERGESFVEQFASKIRRSPQKLFGAACPALTRKTEFHAGKAVQTPGAN